MSLLDNVEVDPNPLVVTVNFDEYTITVGGVTYPGGVLSTKFRELYAAYGESKYGATSENDYVAHLLIRLLKEFLKEDIKKAMIVDQAEAQQIAFEQAKEAFKAIEGEIDEMELVKS